MGTVPSLKPDATKRRLVRAKKRLSSGLPMWARGIHGNIVEFAPDMPVVQVRVPQTPERRLCAAVLQTALDDLRLVRLERQHPRARAAREWIESGEHHWPFAFETICDYLGLSAEAIHTALAARDWRPGRVGPRGYVAMPHLVVTT